MYEIGLIESLVFWCPSFFKFRHKVDTLKSILYKNRYPQGLVKPGNSCII